MANKNRIKKESELTLIRSKRPHRMPSLSGSSEECAARLTGSSSASTAHCEQKVSARASRMSSDASTFWPALQRPRMSSSVSPCFITTR